MLLPVMSIMFMLLCASARAADLYEFPAQTTAQLRTVVRTYLNGTAPPAVLEIVNYARMDQMTLVVSGLDEVDTFLRVAPPADVTHRVGKVVDWLTAIPLGPNLPEPQRERLRVILRPFLERSRASKTFAPVTELYRRLDLWDQADADYVLDEIPTLNAALTDRLGLITRLARGMALGEIGALVAAIRANTDDPIVRFALLDEIGELPERSYLPTLLGVRLALRPTPHRPGERERKKRRIYLRLLARWQTQWRAGDVRVEAAVEHLAAKSETPPELKFVAQFRAGRLPTEPTAARLNDHDPLGLGPPAAPSSNVVQLSACVRPLAGTGRSQ